MNWIELNIPVKYILYNPQRLRDKLSRFLKHIFVVLKTIMK